MAEYPKEATPPEETGRCPNCDTLNPPQTTTCIMCGTPLVAEAAVTPAPEAKPEEVTADGPATPAVPEPVAPTPAAVSPAPEPFDLERPAVIESVMIERQSSIVSWLTGVFIIFTAILAMLVWQNAEPVTSLALFPTLTPLPPTITLTPTQTLVPTETPVPSETPTLTPSPAPTETPRPPRQHPVAAGETLYGLSLFYDVGMEIIASLNGFTVQTPLQAGTVLEVPWPTATPPLVPVEMEIGGEQVIADPTDCNRVEIQAGDSIAAVAGRHNVNFELLMRVNRLTPESTLRPGDTICIPEVVFGGVLPPTPGPSPTAAPTSFPEGPQLLYPPDGTRILSLADEPIILQWLAVKDLAPDEWYMVEVTDLDIFDSPPHHGFTRQNNFTIPDTWRPTVVEEHQFRWRVSIVRVTGQRQDGAFIYTFGGRPGEEATFFWMGAIPTATPRPTLTPTPTPTP